MSLWITSRHDLSSFLDSWIHISFNGDLLTAIYVFMVGFATSTRYSYYDHTLSLSPGLNNFVYMRKVTYVMFPLICKYVGLCLVRHTTIRDLLFMMHRGGLSPLIRTIRFTLKLSRYFIRLMLFAAIGRQRNHIGILRGRRCACWWERCYGICSYSVD